MDVGQGILFACVEGNAEWQNVLLLMIVKDTFSERGQGVALSRGVNGYNVAHSQDVGPSRRGVAWQGRHKGEHRVAKTCCCG